MVLGFNWISRKRWISEGEELTKGRNVQLPSVHVYLQYGVRGVRGAVFRDIEWLQFVNTSSVTIIIANYRKKVHS